MHRAYRDAGMSNPTPHQGPPYNKADLHAVYDLTCVNVCLCIANLYRLKSLSVVLCNSIGPCALSLDNWTSSVRFVHLHGVSA